MAKVVRPVVCDAGLVRESVRRAIFSRLPTYTNIEYFKKPNGKDLVTFGDIQPVAYVNIATAVKALSTFNRHVNDTPNVIFLNVFFKYIFRA